MKPAGMAGRATAAIIDGFITFVLFGALVAIATGQAHRSGGNASFNLHGWPVLLWIALSIGYWTVCERLWGMTIGKRVFSIRVVNRDGANPTWRQSATRNVFRLVDCFPYFLPYLLGFMVAKGNEERDRIGDKVAGTRVAAA